MTEEQIALARRAVACRGWKWSQGMLAVEWAAPGMSLTGGRPVRVGDGWHDIGVWFPNLQDPATLGCLLALVREAWGDCMMQPRYFKAEARWCLCSAGESVLIGGRYLWGDTEAEALVAALEAAP